MTSTAGATATSTDEPAPSAVTDRPARAASPDRPTVEVDPPRRASPLWRPTTWREFGLEVAIALGLGVLAGAAAVWAYGLKLGELGYVWGFGGDMTFYPTVLKGILSGQITQNWSLGYPGYSDTAQFPYATDAFHWLQMAVMGQFTSAVTAVNIYVLIGFLEVAAAGYLLLRLLGVFRLAAAGLALSLSLMPWHFERGPAHLFLANYTSAILAIALVAVLWWGALDTPRAPLPRLLRLGVAAVTAVIVGSGGVYYAFMASLLLGLVLVVRVARRRRLPLRWDSVIVAALVPAVTVAMMAADALMRAGTTAGVPAQRLPAESVVYAGSLATMLLPDFRGLAGHWLLAQRPAIGELYNWSGMTAAFSWVVIGATLFVAFLVLSRLAFPTAAPSAAAQNTGYLQSAWLLVLALFATSSINALFAYLVVPEIRGWGRYSVYAATLVVAILGVYLTQSRPSGRSRATTLVAILIVALTALEVGTNGFRGYQQSTTAETDLAPVVADMEQRLPESCPILELPLMEYPESGPINRMGGYDLLLPYLLSEDLRWSFGGMRWSEEGRWGLEFRDDLPKLVTEAKAAGFCGVLLDTDGLANPADLQAYSQLLGNPETMSQSGRWVYFDLTPPPGEAPVATVTPVSGFTPAEPRPGGVSWWQVEPAGEIRLSGLPAKSKQAEIRLTASPCAPRKVVANGRTLMTTPEGGAFKVPVKADAAGSATVSLAAEGGPCQLATDPRPLYLAVSTGMSTPLAE